jgi:hypothetical protein
MATHDYTEDQATVLELLTEFGSNVTIELLSTTPPDGSKPWRGPVTPDSPPASTKTALACQISLKRLELGGTVVKKDTKRDATASYLIAQPLGETADYTNYSQLRIAGVIWDIVTIEKLQPDPNGIILCYYVEIG